MKVTSILTQQYDIVNGDDGNDGDDNDINNKVQHIMRTKNSTSKMRPKNPFSEISG